MWNTYLSLRKTPAITLLLFTVLFLVSSCNNTGIDFSTAQQTNTSCYQQFGVSLSGAEWDDISYRPKVDELKYYAAKGVHLIRLPLRWSRLQPNLNGALNPDEIDWLKSYIGEANKLGITAVIDIHLHTVLDDLNFGSKLPAEALADFWRKLATTLHSIPGICGYGIANEPNHQSGFGGIWQGQANAVVQAIRQVDTSHFIFVGEDNWDSSNLWNTEEAEQLKDPANLLVYEAHSYWDGDATGNYQPNIPPKNESEAKTLVVNNLAPFVNWCGTTHRCFVGEFGVPADQGWLLALDDALQYMKQHHIAGVYWAGGPAWNDPVEGNYILSIEPLNGKDAEQMKVLQKYLSA